MALSKYREILDATDKKLTQTSADLRQTGAVLRKEVERLDEIFAGQCAQLDEAGLGASNGLIYSVYLSGILYKKAKEDLAANRTAQILTGIKQIVVGVPNRTLHYASRAAARAGL